MEWLCDCFWNVSHSLMLWIHAALIFFLQAWSSRPWCSSSAFWWPSSSLSSQFCTERILFSFRCCGACGKFRMHHYMDSSPKDRAHRIDTGLNMFMSFTSSSTEKYFWYSLFCPLWWHNSHNSQLCFCPFRPFWLMILLAVLFQHLVGRFCFIKKIAGTRDLDNRWLTCGSLLAHMLTTFTVK